MTHEDAEDETPNERPRIRFTLRTLLALVTLGCLLGGLCLWSIWSFDERALLLTWGISLAIGECVARIFGRTSLWWPLCGSLIVTAIAFYIVRENDVSWRIGSDRWSWSEYAWKVWRVWAVLLTTLAVMSAIVLTSVRALPRIPAAARSIAHQWRSSRTLRWIAISIAGMAVVTIGVYWSLGAGRWSPYRALRWGGSMSPNLLFCSDGNQFVTVDDVGHVTLWDWGSAGPTKRYRADVPTSDEPYSLYAAMLTGNRLAMASSLDDSVTVYRLPDWKQEPKFSHVDNHQVYGLRSFNDGKRLLIVCERDGLLQFMFWDDVNQQFLKQLSYRRGPGTFYVSRSGQYGGMVRQTALNERTLIVIDFAAQSVIAEIENVRGGGPVVFFDEDRKIAYVTGVSRTDGTEEHELPGVALGAIRNTNRLVLLDFQSLLPKRLDDWIAEVPIVGHIWYFGRVRLLVVDVDADRVVARSSWLYGYGTTINAELSPDGRRLVWIDSQRRLLLWEVPAPGPSR